ncbi:hypothetical protein FB446DRAFT_792573 [Lentinula raphanica]|nr:hypothetical protein FB446DRAFT_792573 [Lentinula raphanica]
MHSEAFETWAEPVGIQVEAVGTRPEAAHRSSLNLPIAHNQHAPSQKNHGPEYGAAPPGATKSTPPLSKNVPKPSSGPVPAVNPINSMPNTFNGAGIPPSFPFTSVHGFNPKVVRPAAASATGDSGSSIYDSMHAPTNYVITPQPAHAFQSTNPTFRFDTPGTSSTRMDVQDMPGRFTPLMRADKGKQKGNEVNVVSVDDTEDI